MMCDEGRKRARGPSCRLLEGARIGGAIGPVGGERRLCACQSPSLQLQKRRARSGGEGHRARVRASLTQEAASAGIEGRAPLCDPRAAPRTRGKLRRESRRVERPELEGPQERAGRLGGAQAREELAHEREEAVRRLGGARQIVQQLRGISGVGDAVQVLAQARVCFHDRCLAQHPQLLAGPLVEQGLEALERFERTGKALAGGPCAPGESRDPPSSADEQMHDEIAIAVGVCPEDDGIQAFGAGIHHTEGYATVERRARGVRTAPAP